MSKQTLEDSLEEIVQAVFFFLEKYPDDCKLGCLRLIYQGGVQVIGHPWRWFDFFHEQIGCNTFCSYSDVLFFFSGENVVTHKCLVALAFSALRFLVEKSDSTKSQWKHQQFLLTAFIIYKYSSCYHSSSNTNVHSQAWMVRKNNTTKISSCCCAYFTLSNTFWWGPRVSSTPTCELDLSNDSRGQTEADVLLLLSRSLMVSRRWRSIEDAPCWMSLFARTLCPFFFFFNHRSLPWKSRTGLLLWVFGSGPDFDQVAIKRKANSGFYLYCSAEGHWLSQRPFCTCPAAKRLTVFFFLSLHCKYHSSWIFTLRMLMSSDVTITLRSDITH